VPPAGDAADKAATPSLRKQIAQLEAELDPELCADARQACALSRTNGKLADSVWLRSLQAMSTHPAPLANEAMRTFAGRYGDGEKNERYMLGILRSLAKGKTGRRGFDGGGMLPVSDDFDPSVDESDIGSIFGVQEAR
jgi:hypothetical protein